MPANHFDERIAAGYDAASTPMFDPAVVGPAVDFLAELAAAHLQPGGCFVVEVGVPDLRRLPPGDTARVFHTSRGYVGFDEYTDLAAQRATSHHWWAFGDRLEVFSMPFRYVWPSELDLMARLAGLMLRERWSSWTREPFTGESTSHVSVWEKVG